MLRSVKSALFGGKKRKVTTVAAMFALAATGSAIAAWVILGMTATGSGGAKGATVSQLPAVTLTSDYQAGDKTVEPGSPGDVFVNVSNADTRSLFILTLNAGAITSDKPACDTTGMAFTKNSAVIGQGQVLFPPGSGAGQSSHVKVGTLSAPSNWDTDCSGAVFSVALTGTTGP